MSHKYYYLAASLPMLRFETKPPLTLKDFLLECQKHFFAVDFKILSAIISSPPNQPKSSHRFSRAWIEWNHSLRNELAWGRALKMDKDPVKYVRGSREFNARMVDVAARALGEQNPLEAEKALDRARWEFLDEMESGHYFDLEFLLVYALRLKILERYSKIDSPEGKQKLSEYQKFEIPAIN